MQTRVGNIKKKVKLHFIRLNSRLLTVTFIDHPNFDKWIEVESTSPPVALMYSQQCYRNVYINDDRSHISERTIIAAIKLHDLDLP